eukprot:jgi/Mesvir1/1293/Mv03760-RA.1
MNNWDDGGGVRQYLQWAKQGSPPSAPRLQRMPEKMMPVTHASSSASSTPSGLDPSSPEAVTTPRSNPNASPSNASIPPHASVHGSNQSVVRSDAATPASTDYAPADSSCPSLALEAVFAMAGLWPSALHADEVAGDPEDKPRTAEGEQVTCARGGTGVGKGGGHLVDYGSFFGDKRCRLMYKAHVERLLTRVNTVTGVAYKDDPTIFSWELMNGARDPLDPSGGQRLEAWVAEMATHVKRIDPRHLLTIGLEGFFRLPQNEVPSTAQRMAGSQGGGGSPGREAGHRGKGVDAGRDGRDRCTCEGDLAGDWCGGEGSELGVIWEGNGAGSDGEVDGKGVAGKGEAADAHNAGAADGAQRELGNLQGGVRTGSGGAPAVLGNGGSSSKDASAGGDPTAAPTRMSKEPMAGLSGGWPGARPGPRGAPGTGPSSWSSSFSVSGPSSGARDAVDRNARVAGNSNSVAWLLPRQASARGGGRRGVMSAVVNWFPRMHSCLRGACFVAHDRLQTDSYGVSQEGAGWGSGRDQGGREVPDVCAAGDGTRVTKQSILSFNPGPWADRQGTDFVRLHRVQGIDYATYHALPGSWLPATVLASPGRVMSWLKRWVRAHNVISTEVLRMPLLLAEFSAQYPNVGAGGLPTLEMGSLPAQPGGGGRRSIKEMLRRGLFKTCYEEIRASARTGGAAGGSLLWTLSIERQGADAMDMERPWNEEGNLRVAGTKSRASVVGADVPAGPSSDWAENRETPAGSEALAV